MALKAVFPLERRRTAPILIKLYSAIVNVALLPKIYKKGQKIQLQGFARKGNETRVIANGVFANGTVRKTRNTKTEYPGAVHLVNKLQKKFNYFNVSDMKKITA